jgi:nanoRNase/pAp phosphatase (c-di-AMP/oligoRNAs hydrolase)
VSNVPYVGVSETGNAIVKDPNLDLALMWFERGDGKIQFSLRGKDLVDCGQIAKVLGNGGGHPNAAGFQKTLEEGRDLVDLVLLRGKYRGGEEAFKTRLITLPNCSDSANG